MINTDLNIRVTVLEDRVQHINDTLKEINTEVNNNDTRLEVIEKQEQMQTLASKWVISAVWAAAGGAVYLLAKFLGVM